LKANIFRISASEVINTLRLHGASSPILSQYACGALRNLANNKSVVVEMFAMGAGLVILDALKVHKNNDQTVFRALGALRALASAVCFPAFLFVFH